MQIRTDPFLEKYKSSRFSMATSHITLLISFVVFKLMLQGILMLAKVGSVEQLSLLVKVFWWLCGFLF